jgi:serine/threonine-protein kinase
VAGKQAQFVPGYRLDGRYELLYPYAQGGMATVWVARVQGKHGFEKLVAVKTMLPALAQDAAFRAMFLDEANIASRIRHPNVADIVDLGEEGENIYMVLEWVQGDSWSKLQAAIQQAGHAFPLGPLLRIAADACAGLHAAHELRDDAGNLLNVVHRDVSPQNVLLTTGGIVKVIDFGIAKALDRLAEQTQTGMHKGKAHYTAPEQVRSRMAVDRRADLWAIGTILYHHLAGRLPFTGKTDLDILLALTEGKPPPPLPPSVPSQVADVVMKALAHAPESRFQTAAEMHRALEAVMPQPTAPSDVAALMSHYLAARLEEKRRDVAEAIAESDERARLSGAPRAARASLIPELAPGSQQRGAPASAPISQPQVSATPATPFAAGARAQPRLRTVHWLIMAVSAAVAFAVWILVVYVAFFGPLGQAPAPADRDVATGGA